MLNEIKQEIRSFGFYPSDFKPYVAAIDSYLKDPTEEHAKRLTNRCDSLNEFVDLAAFQLPPIFRGMYGGKEIVEDLNTMARNGRKAIEMLKK